MPLKCASLQNAVKWLPVKLEICLPQAFRLLAAPVKCWPRSYLIFRRPLN